MLEQFLQPLQASFVICKESRQAARAAIALDLIKNLFFVPGHLFLHA